MNIRSALPSFLALSGALMVGSCYAGPQVGSVVGLPSSSASTVQARVLSSTPVVAQVAVPKNVCFDELRQEPHRSSGAGALMGAIAGGVMGNALGKGAGKALATGVGVMGGAILGDHIENDGRIGSTRSVRRCEQQASYENRVVAYNVVYEYAGQQYSTQMPQEPGRTIALQVTVSPAMASNYAQPPMVSEPYIAPATYYRPNPGVVIYGGRGRDWDRDEHHHRWSERRWHHWH